MAFRDDLGAAQARADALEAKVVALERENERLRTGEGGDESRVARQPGKGALVAPILFIAAAVIAAAIHLEGEVAVLLVVMAVAFAITGLVIVSMVVFVGPDEILVIGGRRRVVAGGREVGYRVVHHGRVLPVPIVERATRMSTRRVSAPIRVRGAYTHKGIRANVDGAAVVRVARREPLVHNAIERFLGRDPAEIARVAGETLEGALREVFATHSLDELQADREAGENLVIETAHGDLEKLGIELDSLEFTSIVSATDDTPS